MTLLLTEWREFRDADPEELGKAVARRNIVDGRNALDASRWRAASWHYRALGVGPGAPSPGPPGAESLDAFRLTPSYVGVSPENGT